jgi:hypothetical protein
MDRNGEHIAERSITCFAQMQLSNIVLCSSAKLVTSFVVLQKNPKISEGIYKRQPFQESKLNQDVDDVSGYQQTS